MIVDCHTHGGPNYLSWWNNVVNSDSDFMEYLNKCRVDKAIVGAGMLALKPKDAVDLKKGNEYIRKFCSKNPKKYLPAVNVTPLILEESLALLESSRTEYGIVWVGELCNYFCGYKYDSLDFQKILDKIMDLDMILQVHCEGNEVEFILERYPNMTVVLPHPGATKNEIDYRIGLAVKNKNLYLDLCGYGADRIGNVEEMVTKIGDDRILFGSDFTVNDPSTVISRIENSNLSKKSRGKILSLNTLSILKSKGIDF